MAKDKEIKQEKVKEKKVKRKKRKPFFRCVKGMLKIIKRKPRIIDLNEGKVEGKGIFISNHSAASGPLILELYFPYHFTPWGTYEMNGNIKSRWNYLYHVYFQQKKHKSKFASFLITIPACVLLKGFYNGMGLISTYPDNRLISTFKKSFEKFKKDEAVLIFPENSSQGYKEILEEYNPGFVSLSKMYYRKENVDLPVYTCYYHKDTNVLVIDKPQYIKPLFDKGMNEKEIAEHFKDRTNELRAEYVVPYIEAKAAKKNKKKKQK